MAKTKNSLSVGTKSIVPIVLLMIAGLFIAYYSFIPIVKRGLQDVNTEYVENYDLTAIQILNQHLDNTETTIGVMNSVLDYVDLADTLPFIQDMSAYLQDSLQMDSIPCYISGPDGKPMLANSKFAPKATYDEYTDRCWKGETVKHLIVDGNNLVESVIVPVIKYTNGKPRQVGTFEGRKNIATQEFVKEIADQLRAECTIFIGNKAVVSTVDAMKGYSLNHEIEERINKENKITEILEVDGREYICCLLTVPMLEGGKEAFLCVMSPLSDTVKRATLITINVGIINVFIYVAMLTLLIILVQVCFIGPIKKIRHATKELSEGEMDLTYRIPVKHMDELGQISSYINTFINRLHEIIKEVQQASNDTIEAVSNLTASSEETSSATNEILGNITSVKNLTEKQSNSISNVDSIMDHASSSIDILNSNVVKQNNNVDESSSSTEQMVGNTKSVSENTHKMKIGFDNLNEMIRRGREKSNDIIEAIKAIDVNSSSLGEANNTIQNIAGETNLLSMNASIESAHAGEAGKGFAVVAGEIRKLAEDSQKQSVAIGESINNISSVIEAAMKTGVEFNEAMNQIVQSTSEVAPLIEQINFAMEEQNSACNQVIDALGQIRESSHEVSGSIKEVIGGMDDTKKQMNDVVNITQSIVGSMDEMAAGSQQINKGSSLVAEEARHVQDKMGSVNKALSQFKL